MKKDIYYIKGFMPLDIVNILKNYSEKNSHKFLETGNAEKEFTINAFRDMDQWDSNVCALVTEWGMKVYDFVTNAYSENFYPFDPGKSHIAKFEPGWGMHEHFDTSKPNDIATLIYINDSYRGGEIYFPEYGIEYKPEPGDLLCFPDNKNYVHGVRPIYDGTRYTTPRWFTRIV